MKNEMYLMETSYNSEIPKIVHKRDENSHEFHKKYEKQKMHFLK